MKNPIMEHQLLKIIPAEILKLYADSGMTALRPSQEKSLKAGLLEGKNLLVCTPTASGKTFVAELAIVHQIVNKRKKAIYTVPLKALASEKFRDFSELYRGLFKVGMSIGDYDSYDSKIRNYDLLFTTNEKLDSLMRHDTSWLSSVGVVVFDEIHLLNDPGRGPTLEVVITMIKKMLPHVQLLGLSATIGNPEELAAWLKATIVADEWRPVKLKKGTMFGHKVKFEE